MPRAGSSRSGRSQSADTKEPTVATLTAPQVARLRKASPPAGQQGKRVGESATLLWLPAPAVAIYALFLLGPALFALVLSFMHWNSVASPSFAGVGNWVSFLTDPAGHKAVMVSFEIVVLQWVFELPISLLLGMFLAGRQRYRAVLSVFYVLPLLFSGVGVGLMWVNFFAPAFGALRSVITQQWLAEAVPSLIIDTAVLAWQLIPFYMLIFQAASRAIPPSLYEAADLDGVGTLSRFRYVTLPQMRYSIVAVTILIITQSLTAFDTYFVMSSGGPSGATTNLSLGVYFNAFQDSRFAYGAVFGITLALLGFTLAVIVSRLGGLETMHSQQEGIH